MGSAADVAFSGEGLLAAVAGAALGLGGFVFREKPETEENLRAVVEQAEEDDHAVHEVGLDAANGETAQSSK